MRALARMQVDDKDEFIFVLDVLLRTFASGLLIMLSGSEQQFLRRR